MLYLIAALLCLAQPKHPQRYVWWAIALLLVVLGIGRLTNIEQIVTNAGRQAAVDNGWYNTRRPIQTSGIYGIVLGGGFAATCFFALVRRLRAPEVIAVLAAGCLLTLIGVRLISLHAVDAFLGRHLFSLFRLQLGWLAEMLLLICIGGAACWSALRSRCLL
jgi:hypothetical protein